MSSEEIKVEVKSNKSYIAEDNNEDWTMEQEDRFGELLKIMNERKVILFSFILFCILKNFRLH